LTQGLFVPRQVGNPPFNSPDSRKL